MKLMMTLLSDAQPGSGEGLAGIIDADVNYDTYGLPYIPAKRLKGILREAAQDLCDVGKLTETQVKELFGKRGEPRGTAFRLSDGYLPDYQQLRAFSKECSKNKVCKKIYGSVFHRQAVLDFYSYTRSQTAIEEEIDNNEQKQNEAQEKKQPGVAKEGSLRTFRVLKKGLTFEFECEGLPDDVMKDLKLICSVTRRFGSSRTRGLGAIVLRCDDSATTPAQQNDNDNDKQTAFQDDDLCVCRLDIRTQGQILVTTEVGNDQVSEAYLLGSFLLGALAEAYIRQKLSQTYTRETVHNDEMFRAMFLNGDVRFGNAYPVKGDDVYFPAPISIVKQKDMDHFYDLAHSELTPDIQTKGGIGEFVVFDGDNAHTCSPDKEIEYHHARPEDNRGLGHAKKGDGQFFQFDVLAPDQAFRAEIIGTYAHLKEIRKLIAKTPTIFLGKSKTAQYGKCALKAKITQIEQPNNPLWPDGEKLVVTLESDMLLCNENGLILPDPACFESELLERLNVTKDQIKREKEKTFLKTKQIGGFVGVWNMPKIQATALAAGSVIVLRNKSGRDLDVTALQATAFGLRTEEGFGRIKLNWHGNYDEIALRRDANDDAPDFAPDLTAANAVMAHIIKQRIQLAIKEMARAKFSKMQEKSENAFLGRLRLFLNNSNNVGDFERQCSLFKQRAQQHLMKLDDVLFLEERESKRQDDKPQADKTEGQKDLRPQFDKKIVVRVGKSSESKKGRFADAIDQLDVIRHIRSWDYPILRNANIEFETMLQNEQQQFDWYKSYALQLITLLKLKNRNKEGGNREK